MTWEMSIVEKHSYAWRCPRRKTLTRCPNDVIGRISADFLSRPLLSSNAFTLNAVVSRD
jgi:hypothetical protein